MRSTPQPIIAQLHLAPSQPAASPARMSAPTPAPLPPKPHAKPAPKAEPPPEPDVEPSEPPPPADAPPAGDDAVAADADATGHSKAAAAAASAPAPAAAADQAGEHVPPPPDAPAGSQLHRFKVNLPPSAELALDVLRTDADGTVYRGEGMLTWQQGSAGYSVKVEAGISLLVTRLNLLVLTSEGVIDDAGIAPTLATEKRKGRAQTATHFNRDAGSISFSASERSYPLLPGSQDTATLPMQLAGIGRADPNQFAAEFDIMVGEDRDAGMYHFLPASQQEIDTRLGKLATVHLVRPPRPGSYNSKLEVWLAPALNWYPVQIRNTESSGAVTNQAVNKITAIEAGK